MADNPWAETVKVEEPKEVKVYRKGGKRVVSK